MTSSFLMAGLFSAVVIQAFSKWSAADQAALRSRFAAWSKKVLPWAIVLMGASLDFGVIVRSGAQTVISTFVQISLVLGIGVALARVFGITGRAAFLVSVGTAICGGSAISALAPIIAATSSEVALAMTLTFGLNAIGLVLFPPLGHALGLDQTQFGTWAALAIHDTSSVVGAGAAYGEEALGVATVLKLTRALWIIPLAFGVSAYLRRESARNAGVSAGGATAGAEGGSAGGATAGAGVSAGGATSAASGAVGAPKSKFPLFILQFLACSLVFSLIPALQPLRGGVAAAGRFGLAVSLFLIGISVDFKSFLRVGPRAAAYSIVLWGCAALGTLMWVRAG